LIKIVVAEGQTVPVGSVVGYIGAAGEKVDGAGTASGALKDKPVGVAATPAPAAPAPAPAAKPIASPTPPPASTPVADAGRVEASPLARKIAPHSGVDRGSLVGSGPGGRVVKRDVEGNRASQAGPAPTGVRPLPAPRSRSPYEDIALTQIRKTIAKRLVTSIGPIPHFFLTTEVDMERSTESREAINKQLGDQGKVSFNDIVIKATALALAKHRACNAWFQDDHIRYWNEVHIGMAVA